MEDTYGIQGPTSIQLINQARRFHVHGNTCNFSYHVLHFHAHKFVSSHKLIIVNSFKGWQVDLLTGKLGFDYLFNYKEEIDLNSTLQRYFPDGIGIYFDNVGGKLLEAALADMNPFGRISVCGISDYIKSGKRASPSMIDVIYKQIMI
ncbi:2-alkenal reductase (NADP(+)-dependent) [Artemisia annua]|uniref:2-alkenal reductase (NADP(+)-dependent) n=1 Tax=Artemisia annua TaxID=35608 RepID=A0A2U1LLJ7_ARTAN|nr:2-alkenal reductase (NADP(+)-dependent) [Artemisia annua]